MDLFRSNADSKFITNAANFFAGSSEAKHRPRQPHLLHLHRNRSPNHRGADAVVHPLRPGQNDL